MKASKTTHVKVHPQLSYLESKSTRRIKWTAPRKTMASNVYVGIV
jgi:hypothetical protein